VVVRRTQGWRARERRGSTSRKEGLVVAMVKLMAMVMTIGSL
jgi:hypothetical protein